MSKHIKVLLIGNALPGRYCYINIDNISMILPEINVIHINSNHMDGNGVVEIDPDSMARLTAELNLEYELKDTFKQWANLGQTASQMEENLQVKVNPIIDDVIITVKDDLGEPRFIAISELVKSLEGIRDDFINPIEQEKVKQKLETIKGGK